MDQPRPESRDRTDSRSHSGERPGAGRIVNGSPPLALRLVSARLRLAAAGANPPDAWAQALTGLSGAASLEIERAIPAPAPTRQRPRAQALRDLAKWAGAGQPKSPALVFEPWLIRSPAQWADPARAATLPRARWMASYLHDTGGGRPAAQRSIDIMLASPHPDACREDEDCHTALPALETLRTMIAAIRAQGRGRLAVITEERARNAMARRLLAADAGLARDGLELEVCTIEDAIAQPPDCALAWDAVIVPAQLRSLVFALLVRASGVTAPWPMLWHEDALCRVSGEALGGSPAALDATLLVQSLALAAHDAGARGAAQRLHQAWASLRERGLVTPARGSSAPYTSEVGERNLVDLVCEGARLAPATSGRPAPAWRALCGGTANDAQGMPRTERPSLSLVSSR